MISEFIKKGWKIFFIKPFLGFIYEYHGARFIKWIRDHGSFWLKQLLTSLGKRGGRRRDADVTCQVCTIKFASYLQPAPICLPILPSVLSRILRWLLWTIQVLPLKRDWNQVMELLYWPRNKSSFPTFSIQSKGWHVKCGQLVPKVNERRELGRHCTYGYTTECLSTLYQSSTSARDHAFLIQGLETTAQESFGREMGVDYYSWETQASPIPSALLPLHHMHSLTRYTLLCHLRQTGISCFTSVRLKQHL